MAEIKLTKGKVALVDEADVPLLSAFKWHCSQSKRRGDYAYANIGEGKKISMHRMLMGLQAGQRVDHINRNGLDNRRENLRLCTASQNSANTVRTKGLSRLAFRGVEVQRDSKKRIAVFRARIVVEGVRIRGRYRPTAEAAARDYDRLARKHFGSFAVLNFPDEKPGGRT